MNRAIDEHIDQLEVLTSAVIDAVVQNSTHSIEQLVIEQCQCIKRIDPSELTCQQRLRLQEVARAVDTQQALLGQALSVSEFFLQRLSETRSFNRIG